MLKPPSDVPPWRLWRLLVTLPRPVLPIAHRVRGAEDVPLFARALSAPEMAWVCDGARVGGVGSRRLLYVALRQGDGAPVFASETEAGTMDELDAASLVNAVEQALALCGPTRLTSLRNDWHVALCEGASHPANYQDAYALGGCYDISFGVGKGAFHVTDHPEWWFGVPQREMIDGHWMAYRAAVAVRVEADKQG